MKTDALIDILSDGPQPVRANSVARALVSGLVLGVAVSSLWMMLWLGPRPDLVAALSTASFWIKFAYTFAFAALSLWTLERLARPGAPARVQVWLAFLPLAAIVVFAVLQWNAAPAAEHRRLLMGGSANVCPWRIVALALPIFIGVLAGLRTLAPTRSALAGAAAGLLAGAAGAFVYAFHCTESAAPFVALWYTLGIAAMGALGAILGRWTLRW